MDSVIKIDETLSLFQKYQSIENYYEVRFKNNFLKGILIRVIPVEKIQNSFYYTILRYDKKDEEIFLQLVKSEKELTEIVESHSKNF